MGELGLLLALALTQETFIDLGEPFGERPPGERPSRTSIDVPYRGELWEEISNTIKQHRADAVNCFRAELKRDPTTSTKFTIAFVIEPNGHVSDVKLNETIEPSKPKLQECVISRIRTWVFPPRNDGKATHVTHPWIFIPPPPKKS